MKTLNPVTKLILLTLLSLTASACGVIPSAYRGQYADEARGIQLELKTSEGSLQLQNGRTIKVKADNLEFEKLMEGAAGIYVSLHPTSKNHVELFWIGPKPETKKEAGGLIWFESEVLYTLMNTRQKDPVSSFELIHCESGTVLLDPSTKRWQIGCPAGPVHYFMKRIQNKLVEDQIADNQSVTPSEPAPESERRSRR